jgi:hypothetical protein
MISLVKAYTSNGLNVDPLPDWYALSGKAQAFKARPVVGAHLALVRFLVTAAFISLTSFHFSSPLTLTTRHPQTTIQEGKISPGMAQLLDCKYRTPSVSYYYWLGC